MGAAWAFTAATFTIITKNLDFATTFSALTNEVRDEARAALSTPVRGLQSTNPLSLFRVLGIFFLSGGEKPDGIDMHVADMVLEDTKSLYLTALFSGTNGGGEGGRPPPPGVLVVQSCFDAKAVHLLSLALPVSCQRRRRPWSHPRPPTWIWPATHVLHANNSHDNQLEPYTQQAVSSGRACSPQPRAQLVPASRQGLSMIFARSTKGHPTLSRSKGMIWLSYPIPRVREGSFAYRAKIVFT